MAFTIYTMAGREIFLSRKQLRAFKQKSGYSMEIETPFDSYKTTEVNITSEVVPMVCKDLVSTTVNTNVPSKAPSGRGSDRYTVKIGYTPLSPRMIMPRTPSGENLTYRKNKATMEANTAAWGYTKCAVLFFISLLITWVSHCLSNALCNRRQVLGATRVADFWSQVPSSINRVYSLVHPGHVSVPFTYASGVVLPLMGFWNSIIYITTSWTPCKMLFRGLVSDVSHQQLTALRGRSTNIVDQRSVTRKKRSNESVSESVKGLVSSDAV